MPVEVEVIEIIEVAPDGDVVEFTEVVEIEDRPRERVVIRVDNKDNGETLHMRAPLSKTIDEIVTRVYGEFRATRNVEDRLTCRGDGTDVFQHAHLTLRHYLREGHCPKLRWAFAGGTGGARR